jgi:hypothetical protein
MTVKPSFLRLLVAAACTFASTAVGRADPPPPPDLAHVQFLLDQLDHNDYARRKQADQALRGLGVGVVPLLREQLRARPPLEIVLRLESIIQDLTRLNWHQDLARAREEARRSGKMLLVVSALGKPDDGLCSLAVRAFATKTLTDLDVIATLERDFVLCWHDHLTENWYQAVQELEGSLPTFGMDQIAAYAEGRGSDNLRIYLARSDGRILRRVLGVVRPAGLLEEARRAGQIRDYLQNGSPRSQSAGAISWRTLLASPGISLLQSHDFDPALLDRASFRPELLEPVLTEFAKRSNNPLPHT